LIKTIIKIIFARLLKQEYMSFLDLFDSGFKKRNEDHFAAIVRVAMDDGIITEEEKAFLDRLARNLDISEGTYKEILKDYQSHPINPPTSYDRRLERLYDLARMVFVDHIQGDHEELVLRKIAVGLGFSPDNVKYVVDKALTLVSNGVDLDTFTEEIKNMNR
jgi:uncharacterized tellurite resistance protein B-like protein